MDCQALLMSLASFLWSLQAPLLRIEALPGPICGASAVRPVWGWGQSLISEQHQPKPRRPIMLAHKSPSNPQPIENGLGGCSKSPKTPLGLKSAASIRDKISQWEGKTETTGSNTQTVGMKETEVGKKKEQPEVQRKDSTRLSNWERQKLWQRERE